MTELVLRKRKALPNEIGLFVESEAFSEEWESIRIGAEVEAECRVPEESKYRKFFFALCGLLAQNCDWLTSKDDAKEKLLLECRHATYHHDKLRGTVEVRAKTIRNLSSDQWIRLLRRASHAVSTKFIPGMPENQLKQEIEGMING